METYNLTALYDSSKGGRHVANMNAEGKSKGKQCCDGYGNFSNRDQTLPHA